MDEASKHDTPWDNLKRHWVSSLGVQAWLVEAARCMVSHRIQRLIERVAPGTAANRTSRETGTPSTPASGAADLHSAEGLGGLIETLRQALVGLDDVRDYDIVDALDNQMYQLWKELERTMQRHRRSEARYQLKEMFRI